MNNRSYIWTKFTIPEWGDNWFLNVGTIEKVKKLIQDRCRVSVTWFRVNDWLHWELGRPIDELDRMWLQEELTKLINQERPPNPRDLLLRWEGVYTEVNTAMALNGYIQ